MLLKILRKYSHTFAFRLSMMYSLLLSISSILIFLILYFSLYYIFTNQFDNELVEEAEELHVIYTNEGVQSLKDEIEHENQTEEADEVFICLLTHDHTIIQTTDLRFWNFLLPMKVIPFSGKNSKNYFFQTLKIPHSKFSVRIIHYTLDTKYVLQFGMSNKEYAHFLGLYLKIFYSIFPLVFIISTWIGFSIANRSMKPINTITQAAHTISSTAKLEQRVPVEKSGSEIEILSKTFNMMLERIQALITSIQEMNNDIAHDLKSPLTAMRGISELILSRDDLPDEIENHISDIIEECDRLIGVLQTMFTIQEAEIGINKVTVVSANISEIISNACDLFEPLAEAKNISLHYNNHDNITALVHVSGFQRVIANILDNAIKYTPPNGSITLDLIKKNKSVLFTCTDTGIGIEQHELQKIFNRFYRCDKSRNKPGSGLGLSLVKALLPTFNASISVASDVNKGSSFTITVHTGE